MVTSLLEDHAASQSGMEVVIAVLALAPGERGLTGAVSGSHLRHPPLLMDALDKGAEG